MERVRSATVAECGTLARITIENTKVGPAWASTLLHLESVHAMFWHRCSFLNFSHTSVCPTFCVPLGFGCCSTADGGLIATQISRPGLLLLPLRVKRPPIQPAAARLLLLVV